MAQTLIIFILLLQIFFIFYLIKDKSLNKILKLAIICYIIFWIFAPGITALVLDQLNNKKNLDKLLHKDFCIYYVSEFFILTFSVIIVKFFSNNKYQNKEYIIPEKIINKIIFFLLLILLFDYFTTPKLSYIENNTLDETSNNILTPITSILKAIFFSFLIFSSCVIRNKKVLFKSLFGVIITVAFFMTSGARISISAIFFIFLYRLIYISKSRIKLIFNLILSFVFILFFVLPILIGIERARSDELNLSEISNNIDTDIAVSIFSSVFQKFNSVDAGIKLVKSYGSGVAGFRPYLGSLFIFVPQYVFPNKPISGSIDNTYFGTPARLVPQYDNPSDLTANVGVSPLAVTIWQFGFLIGPLILLIFTILNLFFLNHLLNSNKLIINTLGVFLIPLPGFIGVFSSPDLYLKNAIYFLLFYILIFLFNIMQKLFFELKINN